MVCQQTRFGPGPVDPTSGLNVPPKGCMSKNNLPWADAGSNLHASYTQGGGGGEQQGAGAGPSAKQLIIVKMKINKVCSVRKYCIIAC